MIPSMSEVCFSNIFEYQTLEIKQCASCEQEMKLKSSEVEGMNPGLLAWRWEEKLRGRGELTEPIGQPQGQMTWLNNTMIYIYITRWQIIQPFLMSSCFECTKPI
jgi:hypothetical protein